MRSVTGLLIAALTVLATVYLYNKFVAKDGKTIADLGKAA